MTARDKYRQDVVAARDSWHLFCVEYPRPNIKYEQQLIRSAVGEVLSLRFQAAYAPILGTLKRMELQMGILTESGRIPFAPPTPRPAVPPMLAADLPEFLRPERTAIAKHG